MTDTKHPAEVLADDDERLADLLDQNGLANASTEARCRAAMLRRIPALEAERADAIAQQAAALDLVARIRQALGDDGRRMQDELIEWCKTLVEAKAELAAHQSRPWEKCKHHGLPHANEWACPSCLRELRAERDALRAEVERQLDALRVAVVALAGATVHQPDFWPAYKVVSDTIAARARHDPIRTGCTG